MADVFSFDHQGLEYLNMAMAQVTDNPAMVDGSSIHQEAKQHMQTGKPLGTKQGGNNPTGTFPYPTSHDAPRRYVHYVG